MSRTFNFRITIDPRRPGPQTFHVTVREDTGMEHVRRGHTGRQSPAPERYSARQSPRGHPSHRSGDFCPRIRTPSPESPKRRGGRRPASGSVSPQLRSPTFMPAGRREMSTPRTPERETWSQGPEYASRQSPSRASMVPTRLDFDIPELPELDGREVHLDTAMPVNRQDFDMSPGPGIKHSRMDSPSPVSKCKVNSSHTTRNPAPTPPTVHRSDRLNDFGRRERSRNLDKVLKVEEQLQDLKVKLREENIKQWYKVLRSNSEDLSRRQRRWEVSRLCDRILAEYMVPLDAMETFGFEEVEVAKRELWMELNRMLDRLERLEI